jgi:hypothetical protein
MHWLIAAILMLPRVSENLYHRKIGITNAATEKPLSRNPRVKKLLFLIFAMMTPLLSGCYGKGSSADPPSGMSATAGDGRVKVEWVPVAGVDYWLFSATDSSITAFNWSGLDHAYAASSAPTPFYMCGLINDLPYYFVTNGRIDGGPGGASSTQVNATPYNASDSSHWTLNPTPLAQPAYPNFILHNIYGIGYASLTTCGNNPSISSTGLFAAVGAGGAIFTSSDGITWSSEISPMSSSLNAIAGYAANQNNALNPGLRWMAVGDAGAVAYYDGTNWVNANTYYPTSNLATVNPPNPTDPNTLRSVTQVSGTFYAVGDAGTIISSPDAINWTHRPYNAANATTYNLNGVTYGGGLYVAVGDNGTLLTSSDGNTWAIPIQTPALAISANLQKVAAFTSVYGNIYVAVGDGGTIVTRTNNNYNNNLNWTAQTPLTGNPDLVGITVESRGVETNSAWGTIPAADLKLGFISSAQFVAIDSSGNTYTSVNGYDWSSGYSSGASLNALTSSGFGYVAAGNNGASAYAF